MVSFGNVIDCPAGPADAAGNFGEGAELDDRFAVVDDIAAKAAKGSAGSVHRGVLEIAAAFAVFLDGDNVLGAGVGD